MDTAEPKISRSPLVVVIVVLALIALGGWLLTARDSESPFESPQRTSIDGKIIEEFDIGERVAVAPFEATLLNGKAFDSRDELGRVVVYNVWGSWCGPCRTEAPDLARVARESSADTTFVGINVRDNDGAAQAFERSFKVPYESVSTESSADALLSFGRALSSAAIPSTVVIDREGLIAARIVGPVTYTTLRAIVVSVVNEGSSGRR